MPKLTELLRVARLCRDVYQHTNVTESLGIIGMEDFAASTDYACAYISDDEIFFVVRGTDDLADWKSNFRFIGRSDWCGMSVHKGFAEGSESLLPNTMRVLDKYPVRRITFAGHSRGGAIALLLALYANRQFNTTRFRCITFGQPRVSTGRQIALSRRDMEYIRVQNGSDAVCRYPKIGYSHDGTCVYLSNDGHCRIDPAWYQRFNDRFLTFTQRRSDHSMSDYVKELQLCAAQ